MSIYVLAIIALKLISIHAAVSGKATFYGGNENGNACGYIEVAKSTFPEGYYAATGSINFDSGYGCGKCFKIKCIGPYGNNPSCSCSDTPEVIVQTLDQCPECSTDHFDLNPSAMIKITGSQAMAGTCGVLEIEYERVDCDYQVPIRVRNKAGTSRWWYGLHLDNLAGPGNAKSIQLYQNNDQIGFCTKSQGPSFWICTASSGSFPNPPWDLKLIADDGSSVTASGCITSVAGGASMTCNVNFRTSGNSGGNTPTPRPTTTTARPTERPTPATGGGVAGNIVITNKDGLNQWWYAVVVSNNINGLTVTGVRMKDANMVSLEEGVVEWDYVKFTNNPPYEPPFTFEITFSNGRSITRSNVISTLNEGDSGVVSVSDSYLLDDSDDDTLSWAAWFGICVIVGIIFVFCIVSVYCIVKKRKSKIEVGFDDKYDENDKEEEDVNTNDKDDPQEIEVDVQLTTAP